MRCSIPMNRIPIWVLPSVSSIRAAIEAIPLTDQRQFMFFRPPQHWVNSASLSRACFAASVVPLPKASRISAFSFISKGADSVPTRQAP